MKSKKSMKNILLDNIIKNHKLETAVVLMGIIWFANIHHFSSILSTLDQYFTESRNSAIASFMGVIIGIYISVWSIIATSTSKINAEILKHKIEAQLFFTIILGIVEATLSIIFFILVPPKTVSNYSSILLFITTLAFLSFIKFLITIIMITKLNIDYTTKEIDAERLSQISLSAKLDEIYQRIIK